MGDPLNPAHFIKQISCQRVNFSNYFKTKDYSKFLSIQNGAKLPILLTVAYFY
jgi:hypothetical protein